MQECKVNYCKYETLINTKPISARLYSMKNKSSLRMLKKHESNNRPTHFKILFILFKLALISSTPQHSIPYTLLTGK